MITAEKEPFVVKIIRTPEPHLRRRCRFKFTASRRIDRAYTKGPPLSYRSNIDLLQTTTTDIIMSSAKLLKKSAITSQSVRSALLQKSFLLQTTVQEVHRLPTWPQLEFTLLVAFT